MTIILEFYEGQLSAQAAENREPLENRLNELYEGLDDLIGLPRLKRLKEINTLEQQLAWQGANPKALPFDELSEHIRQGYEHQDTIEKKYAARISNRATAIRSFCVNCQGGFVAGVKDCASVTCPLHPFRMGKDPFRGWALPVPHSEPELPEDEEDVGIFEDGDDHDQDYDV